MQMMHRCGDRYRQNPVDNQWIYVFGREQGLPLRIGKRNAPVLAQALAGRAAEKHVAGGEDVDVAGGTKLQVVAPQIRLAKAMGDDSAVLIAGHEINRSNSNLKLSGSNHWSAITERRQRLSGLLKHPFGSGDISAQFALTLAPFLVVQIRGRLFA